MEEFDRGDYRRMNPPRAARPVSLVDEGPEIPEDTYLPPDYHVWESLDQRKIFEYLKGRVEQSHSIMINRGTIHKSWYLTEPDPVYPYPYLLRCTFGHSDGGLDPHELVFIIGDYRDSKGACPFGINEPDVALAGDETFMLLYLMVTPLPLEEQDQEYVIELHDYGACRPVDDPIRGKVFTIGALHHFPEKAIKVVPDDDSDVESEYIDEDDNEDGSQNCMKGEESPRRISPLALLIPKPLIKRYLPESFPIIPEGEPDNPEDRGFIDADDGPYPSPRKIWEYLNQHPDTTIEHFKGRHERAHITQSSFGAPFLLRAGFGADPTDDRGVKMIFRIRVRLNDDGTCPFGTLPRRDVGSRRPTPLIAYNIVMFVSNRPFHEFTQPYLIEMQDQQVSDSIYNKFFLLRHFRIRQLILLEDAGPEINAGEIEHSPEEFEPPEDFNENRIQTSPIREEENGLKNSEMKPGTTAAEAPQKKQKPEGERVYTEAQFIEASRAQGRLFFIKGDESVRREAVEILVEKHGPDVRAELEKEKATDRAAHQKTLDNEKKTKLSSYELDIQKATARRLEELTKLSVDHILTDKKYVEHREKALLLAVEQLKKDPQYHQEIIRGVTAFSMDEAVSRPNALQDMVQAARSSIPGLVSATVNKQHK